MRRFLARVFGTDADPNAFMEVLTSAQRGVGYTKSDQYYDFRCVFMGESDAEQGKRVLAAIFKKGGMWSDGMASDNPYEIAARAGAGDLCKYIMAVLNADPSDQPAPTEKEHYQPLHPNRRD